MSLHLGILRTDAVLDEFQTQHGDYPQMFRQLFLAVDPKLSFAEYDVARALPAAVNCDAYVITGSRHSVYDDLAWIGELVAFVRRVLDAGGVILGICFGHQLMAHFFGGRVAPAAAGWAVGVQESEVSARSWMGDDTPAQIRLLSSHKDQVATLPAHADLFASNDFCPVAGFTLGDQVITVQGHPEFAKPYAAALMNYRREILGEPTYQAGIDSLTHDTDELIVARWMLEFVRQSRRREADPEI